MARRLAKYQWPSSLLDPELVHRLHLHSRRSGVPITVAVREAVLRYVTAAEERAPRVAEGER